MNPEIEKPAETQGIDSIIESFSPLEIKIIPFLNFSVQEIADKSGLDKISVVRALRFLENKGLIKIKKAEKTKIELNVNGIYYRKNHLPERRLLTLIENNNHLRLEEARKISKLSDNEFRVALGTLKKKALIALSGSKISLSATKEEILKKFPEEKLLEILPAYEENLAPEEKLALNNLKSRKQIVEIKRVSEFSFQLTENGKKIAGKEIKSDLIEEITPELIKADIKNRKFRKYDIIAPVPHISGGKRHFVNQAVEYARKVWTDLGFREMTGPLIDSSFWVFDSLFTAQDHPVREMQDTFFIKNKRGRLKERKLLEKVKKAHESGVSGSTGWQYSWDEREAEKLLLRTHTTSLSARTLFALSQDRKGEMPAKYFAIGKAFRNETIDWSHGIEFYQTEGIVVDKKANFSQLLGYLKEFYLKMGFEKIRFRPGFFPYTEPSVEVEAFHPEKKKWLELGGAGILRPEVTVPLLGEDTPVLAWGQGLDRIIMDFYKIKDLRELYSNNIKILRTKKYWMK